MTVLQVSNLTAGYGDSAILKDVNLHVDSGEIVAVVGPNGAGKSTLLKALLGLVKVHSGKITFMTQDITAWAPESVVRVGIAYVPQVATCFPPFRSAKTSRSCSRAACRAGRRRRGLRRS